MMGNMMTDCFLDVDGSAAHAGVVEMSYARAEVTVLMFAKLFSPAKNIS